MSSLIMTKLAHSVEGWHPLSSAQRNFWFLYKLRPQLRGTYSEAFCVQIVSGLDVTRLSRVLNLLASRHPMLRVRFREIDGQPEQCVDPNTVVPIEVFDAEDLDYATLKRRVAEDYTRPFDLACAPLLRASVYRLRDQQCVLLLVIDHIICDGWSYWRLIVELGEILDASKTSTLPGTLRGKEQSYFEYIRQQQQWLNSKQGVKQFTYWQQALRENSPVLKLPIDNTRIGKENTQHAAMRCVLPADLSGKLRQLASRHGAWLYVTLLTAYFILLRRLTGQDHIAVGSPVPARGNAEWHNVVGLFFNPVVLQASFEPSLTVAGLLRAVRRTTFRALANQDYPLSELAERLNPLRDHTGHPYFQTMFVFQNPRGSADILGLVAGVSGHAPIRWGGCEVLPFWRPISGGAGFDLVFQLGETGEEIVGGLEYATALFEPETIERYLGYWRRLLEGMAADDGQAVDRLPLLSGAERQRVLVEWNATEAGYPQDKCVHELFEAQAARTPGAVAVEFEERQLSYGELNARANRLAHHLRGLGVKPDDRVGICVERSFEMIVGLLAILKAGGAYVPLDPAYPAGRLAFMLEDSAPAALLTDSAGPAALSGCSINVPVVDLADAGRWADEPAANLDCASLGLTSRHLAYVIYTSGSTGTPKGVMVEHRRAVNSSGAGSKFAISPRKRSTAGYCCFASFSFDGCISEIAMDLVPGGLVAACRLPGHCWQRQQMLTQVIADARITHVTLLALAVLCRHSYAEKCQDGDPLQRLIMAGDAASQRLVRRWGEHHQVINAYGPTETTVCAIFLDVASEEDIASFRSAARSRTRRFTFWTGMASRCRLG